MRYLIIGLGIYGSNLARDLTDMGHEVIGADIRQSNIEAIKDYISTVYLIDTTEETAIGVLPLKNVDLVIVAIGENFGASVKTVALLKQNGVKHIYARAIDKLHESILQGFEVERIITPEQRAASDLVNEMGVGGTIESMKIDENNWARLSNRSLSTPTISYSNFTPRSFSEDLPTPTSTLSAITTCAL